MVQLRERRNRKDFELMMWNASERSCVSWAHSHARYLIVRPIINQSLHSYTQRSVDTAQYLKDWAWSGVTALPWSGILVSAILLSLTSQGKSPLRYCQSSTCSSTAAENAHWITSEIHQDTPFRCNLQGQHTRTSPSPESGQLMMPDLTPQIRM
jgi:hypothetical protein